jgi:hypothetical protein
MVAELHEVAAGAKLQVVADRGGSGGGDLVAELAAPDVGHVAQEHERPAGGGGSCRR